MDMLPQDWATRRDEVYTGRFQEGAECIRVQITTKEGKQSTVVVYDHLPVNDKGDVVIKQDPSYTVVVLDAYGVTNLDITCGRLVMLVDGVAKMRMNANSVGQGLFLAENPDALEIKGKVGFQRQDAVRDGKTIDAFRNQILGAIEEEEGTKLVETLFDIYKSSITTKAPSNGAPKFFGLA